MSPKTSSQFPKIAYLLTPLKGCSGCGYGYLDPPANIHLRIPKTGLIELHGID